jgi:hypothetical protein
MGLPSIKQAKTLPVGGNEMAVSDATKHIKAPILIERLQDIANQIAESINDFHDFKAQWNDLEMGELTDIWDALIKKNPKLEFVDHTTVNWSVGTIQLSIDWWETSNTGRMAALNNLRSGE